MRSVGLITSVVATALLAACSSSPEAPASEAPAPASAAAPAASSGGSVITASRGGFIPEGIEYDQASGRFLTGSLAEGTIFEIKRDGTVAPVIQDKDLVSSVGIEVDEARNRLLVANSDRAVFEGKAAGQAKLGVYDLKTGQRLAMVDLAAVIGTPSTPPAYFANDVAVDAAGNAYVTDTRMNVVYRVTPDYRASVLHRFTNLAQGSAVNGIVHHDNGYLLVVAGQDIYKVPVANPAGTTQVKVTEPVGGQDGIVWTADGRLAAVSNSATEPRLVVFESTDDWASARRAGVAVLNGQATTAAVVGNEVWAIHPHFADAEVPTIERADVR